MEQRSNHTEARSVGEQVDVDHEVQPESDFGMTPTVVRQITKNVYVRVCRSVLAV